MHPNFSTNMAIICCNQRETSKSLELLDREGWVWADGSSLLEKDYFDGRDVIYLLYAEKEVRYTHETVEGFKRRYPRFEVLWFGDEFADEDQSVISDWLKGFKIIETK